MKIDTKPLGIGKSSVEAQGSWGQIDQADDLMIALYTIDANSDDIVKGLKAEREMMKKAMEFFKSVLGLNENRFIKLLTKSMGK